MSQQRQIRAASYCRTSGEGQRDNTSIDGIQKPRCEALAKQNGWRFVRHYVDECLTGKKIVGREDFQQMMRDAARDEFDILIPFDIDRFARDGLDILNSARLLKREFQVDVVDTSGRYDSRDPKNVLMQFVSAGMAEQERLKILDRTMSGRIARAREGKPWCSNLPKGRQYDEKTGWTINKDGHDLKTLLTRCVKGESLTALCREFGISSRRIISDWVDHGQLAGQYCVTFNSPEIGIHNLKIPVPAIPEVISQALLEKVKARFDHNRRQSRPDVQKYRLTGFVRCAHCLGSMTGQLNDKFNAYYRHKCTGSLKAVRVDQFEPAILDYLYGKFLDAPAFNRAVEKALPPAGQRKALVAEQSQTKQRLINTQAEIDRLVDAVAKGVKLELLLSKQEQLTATLESLDRRLSELETEIAQFPDATAVQMDAEMIRIRLIQEHRRKNWRDLSYDDVQQFLIHLFGQRKRNGQNGIFVSKDERGRLHVDFRGQIEIERVIVADKARRAVPAWFSEHVDGLNADIRSGYERAVAKLRPVRDNKLSRPPLILHREPARDQRSLEIGTRGTNQVTGASAPEPAASRQERSAPAEQSFRIWASRTKLERPAKWAGPGCRRSRASRRRSLCKAESS